MSTPSVASTLQPDAVSPAGLVTSPVERPRPTIRRLRVALLGYGLVGQGVASLAATQAVARRLQAAGLELHWTGALIRDPTRARSGPGVPLVTNAADLLDSRPDVVVEVLGGVEPARTLVRAALADGVPVVTANKTLLAAAGPELRATAAAHRVTLACDAAVLAGVPFLGALARRPLISSATRIAGVLNGTSHFVVESIAKGQPFETALAEAQARGYAEPDSTADISGRDAAEKLCVLLHLAGCTRARPRDLRTLGIDRLTPSDFSGARRLGGTVKPVVLASFDQASPGAWVGPAFVDEAHPFAGLRGVTNALELSSVVGESVTFAGPGAGPRATALTVLDDLVEAVARTAGSSDDLGELRTCRPPAFSRPPAGEWFLAVDSPNLESRVLASRLAARRVPALHVVRVSGRLFALTTRASWPAITRAAATLRESGAQVTVLPVLPSAGPSHQ